MKSFAFTLDRIRNYKSQVLDREKNTLARLRKRQRDIESQIERLDRYTEETRRTLREKQQAGITALELSTFQFYIENSFYHRKELCIDLKNAEAEAERQLKVVIIASQDVSVLDKLEEKQLEEYQLLVAKDNQSMIEEYVSNQVIRAQGSA